LLLLTGQEAQKHFEGLTLESGTCGWRVSPFFCSSAAGNIDSCCIAACTLHVQLNRTAVHDNIGAR
jgi:hypothetical protein